MLRLAGDTLRNVTLVVLAAVLLTYLAAATGRAFGGVELLLLAVLELIATVLVVYVGVRRAVRDGCQRAAAIRLAGLLAVGVQLCALYAGLWATLGVASVALLGLAAASRQQRTPARS